MYDSQLVVFKLGEDEYAVKINYAQEIIRIPALTKIPDTPPFLEGIFNLRGKAIPVFDLKKRFNISKTQRGIDSRLLILELDGMNVGIIVDDVSEVMNIDSNEIGSLGQEMACFSKNSVEGIYMEEERIIILLNALKLKSEILKLDFEGEKAV